MGGISDKINKIVETILRSSTWTSAGDTRVDNFLNEFRGSEDIDFEEDIKKLLSEDSSTGNVKDRIDIDRDVKSKKELKDVTKKVNSFDKGNVGEIQRFTTDQFGNVKAFSSDPAGFIFGAFFKKFARGAGVIALATLIFGAVQFILTELMRPGRWLDRRFRRNIENEIMAFRQREEKQKLNQGFSSIIVTTMGGLRGGSGQTYNSLASVRSGMIPYPNDNFNQSTMTPEGVTTKSKGVGFGNSKPSRFG